MAEMRGRPGRACVVAPARPARQRQDRLRCQGCGGVFPAIDMWIDSRDGRRGFCDGCYYACRRQERAGEEG